MKRFLPLLGMSALLLMASCTKDNDAVDVTGITLSENAVTLSKDETKSLEVVFEPGDATDRNVTWTTSDAAVASVTRDGLVTAVGSGEAVITATSTNGEKAVCDVFVRGQYTFNGVTKNVLWAGFYDDGKAEDGGDEGICLGFSPAVVADSVLTNQPEFIEFDIPYLLLDGREITLKEDYDQSWAFYFFVQLGGRMYYGAEGSNGSGDVKELSMKVIRSEGNKFDVEFTMTLSDDKVVTGKYSGKVNQYPEYENVGYN